METDKDQKDHLQPENKTPNLNEVKSHKYCGSFFCGRIFAVLATMKQLLPITFLLFIFAFSSCSKYEEGPAVSLRTKKARLCQQWYADELISGTATIQLDPSENFIDIYKNGEYKFSSAGWWNYTGTGSWEFSDDKEELRISLVQQNGMQYLVTTYTYDILKLTNKKLWLRDEQGQTIKYKSNY